MYAANRYQTASEVLAVLTPTQVSLNPVPTTGQLAKKSNLAVLIPASILAFALGVGAFLVRGKRSYAVRQARFFAPEPTLPNPPINQPGPL